MAMDVEGYKIIMQKRLSPARYVHSVGVANTAAKLAGMNNLDIEKSYLAGLMHDYAREMSGTELLMIAQENGLLGDHIEVVKPDLLHGTVGAFLLEQEGLITDKQILTAIRNHTTGHPEMDWLSKLIYIADYIEPERKFPGVDKLRAITYKDWQLGVLAGLNHTLTYLLQKGAFIHPYSLMARNRMLEEISIKDCN